MPLPEQLLCLLARLSVHLLRLHLHQNGACGVRLGACRLTPPLLRFLSSFPLHLLHRLRLGLRLGAGGFVTTLLLPLRTLRVPLGGPATLLGELIAHLTRLLEHARLGCVLEGLRVNVNRLP